MPRGESLPARGLGGPAPDHRTRTEEARRQEGAGDDPGQWAEDTGGDGDRQEEGDADERDDGADDPEHP